jgi:ribonuclease HII
VECGCDEAGRGCLAGPVCAAAVIFPYGYTNSEINDSKQLTEKKRYALRDTIVQDALAYAVVEVSPAEIDTMNILRASIHGMNLAIGQLSVTPELILVDGNRFTDRWGIPYRCIVKGDATYLSIAAASILAKTHRDELMIRLAEQHPEYDWKNNKGYPTPKHINAVNRLGLTPYHRKSFHLKNQLSLDL